MYSTLLNFWHFFLRARLNIWNQCQSSCFLNITTIIKILIHDIQRRETTTYYKRKQKHLRGCIWKINYLRPTESFVPPPKVYHSDTVSFIGRTKTSSSRDTAFLCLFLAFWLRFWVNHLFVKMCSISYSNLFYSYAFQIHVLFSL